MDLAANPCEEGDFILSAWLTFLKRYSWLLGGEEIIESKCRNRKTNYGAFQPSSRTFGSLEEPGGSGVMRRGWVLGVFWKWC